MGAASVSAGLRSAYQPSSCSFARTSFPCALRGRLRDELDLLRHLVSGASRPRQNSRSSVSLAFAPSRSTTAATTACCHSGSSLPVTPASATAGCAQQHLLHLLRRDVLAAGDDHLVARGRARSRCPSSSIRPRSPVRSQPSAPSSPRRDVRAPDQDRALARSVPRPAGSAVPAEPGLAPAWPGGSVVTCDAASVSP